MKINRKVDDVPMMCRKTLKYDCVPILSQLSSDKWLEIEIKDKNEMTGIRSQLEARKMITKQRGIHLYAKKPNENHGNP